MLALALLAHAELPPPDYAEALSRSAAAEVERLAAEQGMEAAVRFAERWASRVGPDADVYYEVGLAWRLAGDERRARTALDRALELDPAHLGALYDRGEVRLNAGDLAGAESDFREVVRLAPERWAGHFRLADLAARHGDPAAFERHLMDALRRGFELRAVVGDPRWSAYLADARLGPILRRLVVVYQGDEVLRSLETPPESP